MRVNLTFISLFLFLYSSVASSALVDKDWQTIDDNALLLDTSTGLNWLDLSVTASQSFNDVNAEMAQGGAYEGFRYATKEEVLQLWANAGISDTGFNWQANGEWLAVKDLADRLGTSALFEAVEGSNQALIARHALGMVSDTNQTGLQLVMELSYHPDGANVRTSSNYYFLEPDYSSVHYSSYLVQAVPLPASFWLFASGFVGLLGFLRK